MINIWQSLRKVISLYNGHLIRINGYTSSDYVQGEEKRW